MLHWGSAMQHSLEAMYKIKQNYWDTHREEHTKQNEYDAKTSECSNININHTRANATELL